MERAGANYAYGNAMNAGQNTFTAGAEAQAEKQGRGAALSGAPNVATVLGQSAGEHSMMSTLGQNAAVEAAMDATGMSMSEIYQAMHGSNLSFGMSGSQMARFLKETGMDKGMDKGLLDKLTRKGGVTTIGTNSESGISRIQVGTGQSARADNSQSTDSSISSRTGGVSNNRAAAGEIDDAVTSQMTGKMAEALRSGDRESYKRALSALMAQKLDREGLTSKAGQEEAGNSTKGWAVGGNAKVGTPGGSITGTGAALTFNANFDSSDVHRESNSTSGEGFRDFLEQQADEDFALYDRYGTEDAIAAETNRQAEAWVAQAAGQTDRASERQNPNVNTGVQTVEDAADQAWETTKEAGGEIMEKGSEAIGDAFGALGDEVSSAFRNSAPKPSRSRRRHR